MKVYFYKTTVSLLTLFILLTGTAWVSASERAGALKIKRINFVNGWVEITNRSNKKKSLEGLQICSDTHLQKTLCTDESGFNDEVIEAHSSLQINLTPMISHQGQVALVSLGGHISLPLKQAAYALQLYMPVKNEEGEEKIVLIDYLQWRLEKGAELLGEDITKKAVKAKLWSGKKKWIQLSPDDLMISRASFESNNISNYTIFSPEQLLETGSLEF